MGGVGGRDDMSRLMSRGPATSSRRRYQVPAGTYPEIGEVGFLGDVNSLTVVNNQTTASVAVPGSTWTNNVWYVPGGTTLQGLRVYGGVNLDSAGTLTIDECVFEFNLNNGMNSCQLVINPSPDNSGALVMTDSTLRHVAGSRAPADGSEGGASVQGGPNHGTFDIRRCDISGNADGLQVVSTTYMERNCIHDLQYGGTYPNNTHNDGMMFFDGDSCQFINNRFDSFSLAPYANSAIFVQGGSGALWQGNYFNGGGYTVYVETGTGHQFIDNRWGRDTLYGNHFFEAAASATTWTGNAYADNGEVINYSF